MQQQKSQGMLSIRFRLGDEYFADTDVGIAFQVRVGGGAGFRNFFKQKQQLLYNPSYVPPNATQISLEMRSSLK